MAGKIFIIADLHLSFGTDKPMDIFGKAWENHTVRLEENWRAAVDERDLVIVPGDLSWGLKENEAIPDLEFINKLPGKKILMKGNHELWWSSLTRLKHLRDSRGLSTLNFLYNNAFYISDYDIIVCGTRGWKCPGCESGFDASDLKVYKRELARMKLSLDYGKKLRRLYAEALENGTEIPSESMGIISLGAEPAVPAGNPKIIMCFHFPPFTVRGENSEVLDLLRAEGIEKCWFGHLHGVGKMRRDENGAAIPFSVGKAEQAAGGDICCYLVSADFLELCPLCIDFDGKYGTMCATGEVCKKAGQ